MEAGGVRTQSVINCGGIAEKTPLVLRICASATRRTMLVSRSAQTCALGAAICGGVAGRAFESFEAALDTLTGVKGELYEPDEREAAIYDELFDLYRILHDAFGGVSSEGAINTVMKRLLSLRDPCR
ncbi:MAG: hypothetical protein C4341_09535 [Armatimonadota bacterium]